MGVGRGSGSGLVLGLDVVNAVGLGVCFVNQILLFM